METVQVLFNCLLIFLTIYFHGILKYNENALLSVLVYQLGKNKHLTNKLRSDDFVYAPMRKSDEYTQTTKALKTVILSLPGAVAL